MYYFSTITIFKAFSQLKNKIQNKMLGLLGILRTIDTDVIENNHTYSILDGNLAEWLDSTCYLDNYNGVYGRSNLYIKFSEQWIDFVANEFLDSSVNVYSLTLVSTKIL